MCLLRIRLTDYPSRYKPVSPAGELRRSSLRIGPRSCPIQIVVAVGGLRPGRQIDLLARADVGVLVGRDLRGGQRDPLALLQQFG